MPEGPDAPRRRLAPTVVGLGWVSLLTDVSGELIFPLLPMFLTEVLGAPAIFLGILEGAADATASTLKYFSGRISDRFARAKPIVLGGYGLSTLARPLVALAVHPWHVLVVRIVDRMGKGVRSAPRDAMLAHAASPADRGRSFGFHQAMDHAGAALGTLAGAGLLWLRLDLRTLFWLAAIPGFISLGVLALVPEKRRAAVPHPRAQGAPTQVPSALKWYLGVLLVFTLANASDAFLILKAREVGASRALAPLLWFVLHAVKSSLGTFGGALSDRFGRIRLLALGWLLYGIAYASLGFAQSVLAVFAITAGYGLYGALAEGAERAMVADLAPAQARGRAFGLYNAVNGFGLLGAGLLFGELWDRVGSRAAFTASGALAALAALALLLARSTIVRTAKVLP